MTTPTENSSNYASPYAQRIQQYPSQSADYLSLEIGGSNQTQQEQQPNYQYQRGRGRYSNTPGKRNFNTDGGDSGNTASAAVPYFYQNTASAQRNHDSSYRGNRRAHNFNNRSNGGNNGRSSYGGQNGLRGSNKHQQQSRSADNTNSDCAESTPGHRSGNKSSYKTRKGNTFDKYFHPSMLEDPWQNLVSRRDRLRESVITDRDKDKDDNGDVENNEEESIE